MKTGSFARRIYAVLLSLVLLAGELFAAPAVTYGAEPLTADETEDIMINDIDTGDREGEATGNEDDAITPGEGEVPGIQDVTISDEDGDKGVTEDVNDPDEELSGSIEAKGDGEVVEYDLWVGSTQVTSANCTDLSGAVTGVGATASYDPTTKTLTLDKVTGVNGFAESETYKALIFCKEGSLKLRGNASLIAMDYASKGVVGLNCNLDIAGTFAIVAYSFGVYTNAGYGLTVSGEDTRIEVTTGTFDAINTSEYKQSEGKVLVAGKENGLYAGKAVLDGGVLSATG